jgi:hypothetical protein
MTDFDMAALALLVFFGFLFAYVLQGARRKK